MSNRVTYKSKSHTDEKKKEVVKQSTTTKPSEGGTSK